MIIIGNIIPIVAAPTNEIGSAVARTERKLNNNYCYSCNTPVCPTRGRLFLTADSKGYRYDIRQNGMWVPS